MLVIPVQDGAHDTHGLSALTSNDGLQSTDTGVHTGPFHRGDYGSSVITEAAHLHSN